MTTKEIHIIYLLEDDLKSKNKLNLEHISEIETFDLCSEISIHDNNLEEEIIIDLENSSEQNETNNFQDYKSLFNFCYKNYSKFPFINKNDYLEYLNYIQQSEFKELIFPDSINISINSFKKVLPGEWINDEIINSYIEILTHKNFENNNFFIFNTFFFEQIKREFNYNKLIKFINKKNSSNFYNIYYIPIIMNNHWSLMKVDVTLKTFFYYDSLIKNCDNLNLNLFLSYFSKFFDILHKIKIEWKLKIVENIPQQNNFSDCGIFMLKYLHYLIIEKEFNFSHEDIPYFRILTGLEIIKGKLF